MQNLFQIINNVFDKNCILIIFSCKFMYIYGTIYHNNNATYNLYNNNITYKIII